MNTRLVMPAMLALLLAVPAAAQGPLFFRDHNLASADPAERDPVRALRRLTGSPPVGWTTALPPGTELLTTRRRADELTAVFDAQLLQARPAVKLEAALEQIQQTALQTAFAAGMQLRSCRVEVRDATGLEQPIEAFLDPVVPMISQPAALRATATGALTGRRIAISPGHGYYWHSTLGWTTQRGLIDGLIEDIHTAEIANRYLVPLLENLGATVIVCREHGENTWQAIGDNDTGAPGYSETGGWTTSLSSGYQNLSYRFASTSATATATAAWQLPVDREGIFPVYVWYRASSNRSTDARFTITHTGGTTTAVVDQTRDDRTWVWLGDFAFSPATGARVTLDNASATPGSVVIADAVRVGGGNGSIPRGSGTSGRPRWQECSRYQAQFSGAPTTVFDPISGGQDSDDDVTCRPRFAEWRGADAFVSIHTNAGGGSGTSSYIYNGGASAGSTTLQSRIHSQLITDFRAEWSPTWTDRGQLSANFGEVRLLSTMPGVLLELAFHDTTGSSDIAAIHHPRWRYLAARAIARGMLRYFAPTAAFPPEPPTALRVRQDGQRGLEVAWDAIPGATGYSVEWSTDGKGFVNAADTTATSWSTGPLPHGTVRSFRVRATNQTGRSIPTEVLTAGTDHTDTAQLLLVQGFDRFGRTVKGPENTQDYLRLCGEGLRTDAGFSLGFDSASNEAVVLGRVALASYRGVVWSLGEESTADETFSFAEQALVQGYLQQGGNLMVSGAEIAWDLDARGSAADRAFLNGQFGVAYTADDSNTYLLQAGVAGSVFAGLPAGRFDDGTFGTYDVDWPDVLAPTGAGASICLRYGNGLVAGIQRQTAQGRTLLLGFPIETVTDAALRRSLLQRAARYLLAPLPIEAADQVVIGNRLDLAVDSPTDAGLPYLLLVSDGLGTGLPLPQGGLLPLRPGFLLDSALNPANPFYQNFLGTLDGQGRAAAWIDVPYLPAIAGLEVFFSGLSMQPTSPPREVTVWNWLRCRLAP